MVVVRHKTAAVEVLQLGAPKRARRGAPHGQRHAAQLLAGEDPLHGQPDPIRDRARDELIQRGAPPGFEAHLGVHRGSIYHGADDDGSGTTCMMTLAEKFARDKAEGHGPKRSMLFIAFSGVIRH